MGRCGECGVDVFEWKLKVEELTKTVRKLEGQNYKLESELDSAKFKIRTELEPRIARERRAYDVRISSGGSEE